MSEERNEVQSVERPSSLPPSELDAENESIRLARLIAAQRRHVARLRQRSAPAEEIEAAESILEIVGRSFDASAGTPKEDPLDQAEALARNEHFAVHRSHRAVIGPAVRLLKRAAVEGLEPFHVELLRTQSRFNLELVHVFRRVRRERRTQIGRDLREWVEERLDPTIDPTRWNVPSHRRGAARFLARAAKRSYLTQLAPLLRRVLDQQRQFDARARDLAVLAAEWEPRTAEITVLVHELQRLSEWPSRLALPWPASATTPIWREVFRRQESFNRALVLAVRDIVGVYSRPGAGLGVDYRQWARTVESRRAEELEHLVAELGQRPRISLLVPIYQTTPEQLEACLRSVEKQTYPHWELCVVDDASTSGEPLRIAERFARRHPGKVKVQRLARNSGIASATNAALALATGELVGFLDHDDALAPTALAEVAVAVAAQPDTDVLYSDEDKLDFDGARCEPFLKPDWSPDLLRSVNYVCHFLVIRRALLEEIGGVRTGFEGAQDYDLVLRATERARRITHIPRVLYHWRKSPTSTAARVENKPHASNAGLRAVQEHLRRLGEAGVVEETAPTNFRVRYPLPEEDARVSIIVPFKDKVELLRTLLASLAAHTDYEDLEILLVSNNSTDSRTFEFLESLKGQPRIRLLEWNHPFNWSAINNFAVQHATGDYLLFLNNDIEVVEPGWLKELVSQATRPEVDVVGPQLLYPDGSIQAAGVVVGLGGFAGHPWAGLAPDSWTAFGRMSWYRNFLAVTGACLMIRRDRFEELGGFDERFIVCGSDVELGLRVNTRGKRVVYTPFARLVHHESATRDPQKFPDSDSWMSFEVYRPWLESGDPFYNPNLSLDIADGRLRMDTRRPAAIAAGALALLSSRGRQSSKLVHERRVIMGFVSELDPERPASPARVRQSSRSAPLERVTWLVPYFHHPYGGIHTILRFADLLRSRHGVQSELVVFDKSEATVRELEARVRPLYPEVPGQFRVLGSTREIETLEQTDVVLATFWTSAYFAMRHAQARLRAYFVQDFEPLFYPAGTMYALAEQTYRLGLFGVFNSPGLGEFVEGHYGMAGVSFEPAVDPSIFHDRRPARTGPVRIFFYGRPSADRNGFELGLTALKRLKERLGERVELLSAGEAWSAQEFGMEGMIRNLGVLPYESTAELYRSCDLGLCFMFTKHPSYLPLELMASGVCVITNDNPANRWLLRDEENCLLSHPVASGVLRQLERAATDATLRAKLASTAAERMRRRTWEQAIETVHRALTLRLSTERGRSEAAMDRAAGAV